MVCSNYFQSALMWICLGLSHLVAGESTDCTEEANGLTYTGTTSQTENGEECLRWEILKAFIPITQLPDATYAEAGNNCRNPFQQKSRLWCYTSITTLSTGFCDVPLCSQIAPAPVCLDILIYVDASASVSQTVWNATVIPYLQQFASTPVWQINRDSGVQIAIITSAKFPKVEWQLDDIQTQDKESLSQAIDTLELRNDGTVKRMRNTIKNRPPSFVAGNRNTCPDICVVVFDGQKFLPKGFKRQIDSFKTACTRVVVVALTESAQTKALEYFATDPSLVTDVNQFDPSLISPDITL